MEVNSIRSSKLRNCKQPPPIQPLVSDDFKHPGTKRYAFTPNAYAPSNWLLAVLTKHTQNVAETANATPFLLTSPYTAPHSHAKLGHSAEAKDETLNVIKEQE